MFCSVAFCIGHDLEQSLPLLKAAWDAGVNTIDTANTYSNGDSERIIGNFIKQVCLSPITNHACSDSYQLLTAVQHTKRDPRDNDQSAVPCVLRSRCEDHAQSEPWPISRLRKPGRFVAHRHIQSDRRVATQIRDIIHRSASDPCFRPLHSR